MIQDRWLFWETPELIPKTTYHRGHTHVNCFGYAAIGRYNPKYPTIRLEVLPVNCPHGGSDWLCEGCFAKLVIEHGSPEQKSSMQNTLDVRSGKITYSNCSSPSTVVYGSNTWSGYDPTY